MSSKTRSSGSAGKSGKSDSGKSGRTDSGKSGRTDSPAFVELLTRQGMLDPEEAGLRRRFGMNLVAFALLLAGHVWVSLESRNMGYEGEALGKLIHRLDQERVEIEDALARESRPALLASRAVELGMQKPAHGQLRRLGAPGASPALHDAKP